MISIIETFNKMHFLSRFLKCFQLDHPAHNIGLYHLEESLLINNQFYQKLCLSFLFDLGSK